LQNLLTNCFETVVVSVPPSSKVLRHLVFGFHSPHQLMSQDSVGDPVALSISSSEEGKKKGQAL